MSLISPYLKVLCQDIAVKIWLLKQSETFANPTYCSISASRSNFNPRNAKYIPVVKILAFLELEQKLVFFKGLNFKSGSFNLYQFIVCLRKGYTCFV